MRFSRLRSTQTSNFASIGGRIECDPLEIRNFPSRRRSSAPRTRFNYLRHLTYAHHQRTRSADRYQNYDGKSLFAPNAAFHPASFAASTRDCVSFRFSIFRSPFHSAFSALITPQRRTGTNDRRLIKRLNDVENGIFFFCSRRRGNDRKH